MKTVNIVICLIMVLLSGCEPTFQSVHQLYTDGGIIFDEALMGKWAKDGPETWKFERHEDDKYKLTIVDPTTSKGQFIAHLVQLDDTRFLDVFPDSSQLEGSGFYKQHLLGTHTFMKVRQIEPNLKLRMMGPKVCEMLDNDPNLLRFERLEDCFLITSPTQQLQEFVVKYADANDVFEATCDMKRMKPLYTDGDLVIDQELAGGWQEKDGTMVVEFWPIEEKSYEIIVAGENEEQRFYADLITLNDVSFLGLFFDDFPQDPNDPYDFRHIPDIFAMAELEQSIIKTKMMNYNEVIKILENSELLNSEEIIYDDVYEKIYEVSEY
jgi:hypothetical protein